VNKVLLILLAILIIFVAVLLVFRKDEIAKIITTSIFGGNATVNETTTTTIHITTTTLPQTAGNQTNETSGNVSGAGGGAGGSQQQPTPQTNASKVITLEITDLCEGKKGEVTAISEGMGFCLNQKYPYYLVFQLNESNLTTWVYNVSRFEESYNLENETTVYYLFVEDVSTVTREIEEFYMLTNAKGFYLGNYTLYTIWYSDPTTGEMIIAKMIAAIPLNVDKNSIQKTEGWEEIKFYLKTALKDFYLGNLFVEIK
jgi:hypothetical protein